MMLSFTRRLLVVLIVLNWIGAALLALLLAFVLVEPGAMTAGLSRVGDEAAIMRQSIPLATAAALLGSIALHIIFTRLIAILDAVAAQQPFVTANAARLQTIAWALLAIQLLDLVYGVIAARLSVASGDPFDWLPSPGGWLAVLLLFVLAAIFRHGADMQADIEATI